MQNATAIRYSTPHLKLLLYTEPVRLDKLVVETAITSAQGWHRGQIQDCLAELFSEESSRISPGDAKDSPHVRHCYRILAYEEILSTGDVLNAEDEDAHPLATSAGHTFQLRELRIRDLPALSRFLDKLPNTLEKSELCLPDGKDTLASLWSWYKASDFPVQVLFGPDNDIAGVLSIQRQNARRGRLTILLDETAGDFLLLRSAIGRMAALAPARFNYLSAEAMFSNTQLIKALRMEGFHDCGVFRSFPDDDDRALDVRILGLPLRTPEEYAGYG